MQCPKPVEKPKKQTHGLQRVLGWLGCFFGFLGLKKQTKKTNSWLADGLGSKGFLFGFPECSVQNLLKNQKTKKKQKKKTHGLQRVLGWLGWFFVFFFFGFFVFFAFFSFFVFLVFWAFWFFGYVTLKTLKHLVLYTH